MAYVDESIDVAVSCDVAFELVADASRALDWMVGFSRFALQPGPSQGIGARVQAAGQFLGIPVSTELEIVQCEPGRRLVSHSTKGIRSVTTWSFEPIPQGACVRYTGEYNLPLALRLIGDRLVEQEIGQQIQRSLINLKRLLEAENPPSPPTRRGE